MLLVKGVRVLGVLNQDLDTMQKWNKERMKQQIRDLQKMKAHSTGWEHLSTGSPLLKFLGFKSPLEVSIGYLMCTLCKWRGCSKITKSCTRCTPCVNGEDISCHSPKVSIWLILQSQGESALCSCLQTLFSCLCRMDGRHGKVFCPNDMSQGTGSWWQEGTRWWHWGTLTRISTPHRTKWLSLSWTL